jgi:hypothetical protein
MEAEIFRVHGLLKPGYQSLACHQFSLFPGNSQMLGGSVRGGTSLFLSLGYFELSNSSGTGTLRSFQ